MSYHCTIHIITLFSIAISIDICDVENIIQIKPRCRLLLLDLVQYFLHHQLGSVAWNYLNTDSAGLISTGWITLLIGTPIEWLERGNFILLKTSGHLLVLLSGELEPFAIMPSYSPS